LSLGSEFSDKLRVIFFQVFPALWLVALAIVLFVAKQMQPLSASAWSLVLGEIACFMRDVSSTS